jgi:hypothetical protein
MTRGNGMPNGRQARDSSRLTCTRASYMATSPKVKLMPGPKPRSSLSVVTARLVREARD